MLRTALPLAPAPWTQTVLELPTGEASLKKLQDTNFIIRDGKEMTLPESYRTRMKDLDNKFGKMIIKEKNHWRIL